MQGCFIFRFLPHGQTLTWPSATLSQRRGFKTSCSLWEKVPAGRMRGPACENETAPGTHGCPPDLGFVVNSPSFLLASLTSGLPG